MRISVHESSCPRLAAGIDKSGFWINFQRRVLIVTWPRLLEMIEWARNTR